MNKIHWPCAPKPQIQGVTIFREIPLESLKPFIDWTYLFFAWKMRGTYPDILKGTSEKAEEARKLFEDAQKLLEKIIREKGTEARAVIGIFPVRRKRDSLSVYAKEAFEKAKEPQEKIAELHFLRQQSAENISDKLKSLADYFTPYQIDRIGLFALSAGFGIHEWAARYEAEGNSYKALLSRTLADRLTEALSEKIHQEVMRRYWGYLPENSKPFGIRPAPGYPACPDSSELQTIWKLLDVEKNIGIRLTENCMMLPVSSTAGYYIAHPESRYFSVGKIGEDQLKDYAARKGFSESETRKWLRNK